MEPKEELPNDFLIVNHLRVYALNHHCKHGWMLETEIFKLHFPLSEGEEFFVVIDTLARISSLANDGRCRLPHA